MRLVLADDHNLFREALCLYLRQSFDGVEIVEAASLEEGLRAAERARPDALLLDFVMPGMDGVNGVARAKRRHPDVPVIVLSGNISQAEADEAVRNGAAGVISKDLSGKALVAALRRILAGERFVTSPAWTGEPAAGAGSGGEPDWSRFGLTPRETDVLRLLVSGLADKAIAYELGIAGITVRLHLRNAFRKLGARNRVDAVRIALQAPQASAQAGAPRDTGGG